jgi:hypothetical protein
MPNWVFNSLVVSGEQSQLEKMMAQLNQPFEKHFPESKFNQETKEWEHFPDVQVYDNPIFAFWNIVKPTDLEAYYEKDVLKGNANIKKDADGKFDNDSFMEEFVRSMRDDQDWYHWNVRNWGTKWDIGVPNGQEYSDTQVQITDDNDVMYHFQTAWSPVGEVLMKLSEMYPSLNFDYEYEEEQGWGGTCTFKGGVDIACDQWDIPESHSDYKDRDKECPCEYDDIEYAYKDCPIDTTGYQWNDEEHEWQEITIDIPTEVR